MSYFHQGDRVKIKATQEVGTISDVDPAMRNDELFAEYGVAIDIDSQAVIYGPLGPLRVDVLHSGTVVFCEAEDLEAI